MTRTDNDTWDLASSVGATATAVATSRALASRGPQPLLDDPWAESLVRAVGIENLVAMLDDDRADPATRRTMNEQVAVRTRFFDDFLVEAAASGIRQAVILASGLDTRAYRLPWPSGTVVYEIDQPDVLEFKARQMATLGAECPCAHRAIGIDLRDDWVAALAAAGHDAGRPTAWIAEGLLIYLPGEAQDRLFGCVTARSASGSRIATEQMDLQSLPADWAERLTERSRRTGSDLDLGALFYMGERNAPAEYLTGCGWRVSVLPAKNAYAAHGFDYPDDELAWYGESAGYLTANLG
ncbi:SAM-dependent methyltransferase [Mycolicibacterium flavescens]|uniref:S-adenosyl-L-methionine-dependent methyltransferase n=1 Tax=Mycolicibacterium flavescens TaxID=1776 RepID=A0A1E3RJR2_MYCFV|nr:SAM-dependent methyltransferase [Mycolicibacterium flavescens]MCV7282458.1 SAM-dependent methyltransferase [Mycolicibacterium flavescens]ODQ90098.1 SAM-dependent methyltransferase [Mycolicibacterium flavescens]